MKLKQHIMFGPLASIGMASPAGSISVLALGVTPYSKLKKDAQGFAIHSGTASNDEQVHSVGSRIDKNGAGQGKATVELKFADGSTKKILASEAEVLCAQLVPELASINHKP